MDDDLPDALVYFGDAVKALDDAGRVGGYLIRFGSADRTDASSYRDFFTPETDFGRHVKSGTDLLYAHGLPTFHGKANPLGGRVIGDGSIKVDDAGVWVEGQLTLRDEYERKILQMARAGKLGWSSGTASHRVRRERQPNGAHKVLSWPLGLDASLTPTPAEPRAAAVALKSLLSGDAGAPPTWLDDCLRAASAIEAAAARFAHLPAAKRGAIKSLRDALDGLLAATEPRADPDEVSDLYLRFLETEARLSGVL